MRRDEKGEEARHRRREIACLRVEGGGAHHVEAHPAHANVERDALTEVGEAHDLLALDVKGALEGGT